MPLMVLVNAYNIDYLQKQYAQAVLRVPPTEYYVIQGASFSSMVFLGVIAEGIKVDK